VPAREVKAAAEADARKSDWITQMNQLSEQTPAMAIDRTENNAPRQVFLFSGHMIDAPDRSPPRFPPDKEPLAAAAIDKLLDELGAGTTDVVIFSGACGGDLLFADSGKPPRNHQTAKTNDLFSAARELKFSRSEDYTI